MGSRAERKTRHAAKVKDYKEKIEKVFYAHMDTFAGAIPTEAMIDGARKAYHKEVISLVTACPQEKMLIIEGYYAFIAAVTEKANELRGMCPEDDLMEEGDEYE